MNDEIQVKIDLGDGTVQTVTVNPRSGFLYSSADNFGKDVVIPIPQRYSDVAYEYVSFLNGDIDVINKNIINRYIVKKLFDLSYFFQDDNLFDYLIEQLLQSWSELSQVIWSFDFELLSSILLHCPYQMLPPEFINNKKFFNEWKKKNNNKDTVLNLVEKYKYMEFRTPGTGKEITRLSKSVNTDDVFMHNTEEYYKSGQRKLISIHEKIKDQGVNRQVNESWYENGNCESKHSYVNGMSSGLWQEWYRDGKPKLRGEYDNQGQKHGMWEEWWPRNKTKSMIEYKDGIMNGLYQQTDESGDVKEKGYFVNGMKEGFWQEPGHKAFSDKVYVEYKNGKKYGLYEVTSKEYGTMEKTYYIDDVPNGLSEAYHIFQGKKHLTWKGYYVDGKKQGLWQEGLYGTVQERYY